MDMVRLPAKIFDFAFAKLSALDLLWIAEMLTANIKSFAILFFLILGRGCPF